MIRESMPSGYDPMGEHRFSEKHALGLDPRDHAQNKNMERDDVHHALRMARDAKAAF
jgi:hypothetical protein